MSQPFSSKCNAWYLAVGKSILKNMPFMWQSKSDQSAKIETNLEKKATILVSVIYTVFFYTGDLANWSPV